ncbi:MAG: regulatory protein RecX [Succinivibrio sp.]
MALKGKSAPDDSAQNAYLACIRLLGRREYSKFELMRKLNGRFTPEAARQAVAQCAREGAQSDERFAEMLVRHAVSTCLGPLRLRLEAQKRGFDPDALDASMAEVDFTAVAVDFLRRRYQGADPSDYKLLQKMKAALYRRGFDPSTCVDACEQFSQGD